MWKKILASLGMFAVVATGVAVMESPAQAASCPAFSFCVYTGTDFTGSGLVVDWRTVRKWCTAMPSAFNNNISSIINNTGNTVYYRDSSTCGGTYYPVFQGEFLRTIGPYDNRISAFSVTSSL